LSILSDTTSFAALALVTIKPPTDFPPELIFSAVYAAKLLTPLSSSLVLTLDEVSLVRVSAFVKKPLAPNYAFYTTSDWLNLPKISLALDFNPIK